MYVAGSRAFSLTYTHTRTTCLRYPPHCVATALSVASSMPIIITYWFRGRRLDDVLTGGITWTNRRVVRLLQENDIIIIILGVRIIIYSILPGVYYVVYWLLSGRLITTMVIYACPTLDRTKQTSSLLLLVSRRLMCADGMMNVSQASHGMKSATNYRQENLGPRRSRYYFPHLGATPIWQIQCVTTLFI